MDPLVKPLSVHNAFGVDPLITIEETVNAIRAYAHYRWNSLLGISRKLGFQYDIIYNNRLLSTLCHVVYATLG